MTNWRDRGSKSAPAAVAFAADPAPVAASVLAANVNRRAALIANAGVNTVYLGRDNTVTVANGIPLGPGASLTDSWSSDAWWGIMAANEAGDVRVVEVTA